jgi:hypothetical protein
MQSVAHENQIQSQKQQKTYYDRKARGRSFAIGDKVFVLLPSSRRKLAAEWQGPYEITRQMGPVSYEVDMKWTSKRYRVLHVNMLRKRNSLEQVTFDALEVIVDREEEIPE